MRAIAGYVLLGRLEESDMLFGPGPVSLTTNGCGVYGSARGARGELHALSRRGVRPLGVGYLEMRIAGDADEARGTRGPYVVLAELEGATEFFGPLVEGRPAAYPYPAAYLWENGLVAYPSLERAAYVAQDVARQARSRTRIAAFSFRRLDDGALSQHR